MDSLERLSRIPTLTAKPILFGEWGGYYERLGLHKVTLIFEVDEERKIVFVDAVYHKRQNKYWK